MFSISLRTQTLVMTIIMQRNMDVNRVLQKALFGECGVAQPEKTCHNQQRTIDGYWNTERLAFTTASFSIAEGKETRPSLYNNMYACNVAAVRQRHEHDEDRRRRSSQVILSGQYWDKLLSKGVHAFRGTYRIENEECRGMTVIRNMMKFIVSLVRINRMKLEPFQLKALRVNICSSAERLLGEDLHKYIPKILQVIGLLANGSHNSDVTTCSDASRGHMMKLFRNYSKRIIAVVAPRRNGKSKVGKLFVSVNAACEEGARIVLLAHRLEAIMLYKTEILDLLNQLQEVGQVRFSVHTAKNEIRIDFPASKRSSFIYFVPGGVQNVCMFLAINYSLSRRLPPLQQMHPWRG